MALAKHPFPIVDAHVHYPDPSYQEAFVRLLDEYSVERFALMCVPHPWRLSLVPEALHLKAHFPERVYVFGSVDFSAFRTAPDRVGEIFAENVDTLLAMGCDGLKMWEGKPDIRKKYGIPPFDSSVYAPFWARLAERRLPVLIHINDPAEFWDRSRIPAWALEHGWFYGDGSYVNNEVQYAELFGVLERHPDLTMILAHFGFFSAELERLAGYLDRYPNLYVDLTPGSEMYRSFSRNPDATRAFFETYGRRIIYGTDYGAGPMLATLDEYDPIAIDPVGVDTLFHLVRGFLEVDGPYTLPSAAHDPFRGEGWELRGLGLAPDALRQIYHDTFTQIVGLRPRPISPAAIVAECDRIIAALQTPGVVWPGRRGDTRFVEQVRQYFEGGRGRDG